MATIEALQQRQSAAQERPYRTPPHNLEAEQALLGAILINNDAFDRVQIFSRATISQRRFIAASTRSPAR